MLKKLETISSVSDPDMQADRMWERLLELSLFVRSGGIHRKPTEILKTFIKTADVKEKKLSKNEKTKLTSVFNFLRSAYASSDLGASRLASDQTHFYTMVTSLLDGSLDMSNPKLVKGLVAFGKLINEKSKPHQDVQEYLELSSKQTTDTEKRKERQKLFLDIVKKL